MGRLVWAKRSLQVRHFNATVRPCSGLLTEPKESVAEYTKRPLWTINCSDLGHHPKNCETKLSQSLRLAKKWNAVVLIDEADVFMAAREMKHLERNELVAGNHPVVHHKTAHMIDFSL